jgi:hypothetical protein
VPVNRGELAAQLIFPPPSPYVSDPVAWVKERRKNHVTTQQATILEAVRDHRYTAVHSAHDLGKSYTAGNLAVWWVDSHPPGQAKVVSTAPTGDQVKGILWQEIQVAHSDSGARGRVNQVEWWDGPLRVGFGRKPADYNPAAFQGHHEKFVLVIIDEACGVPKSIFDAVDALVTNEFCRVLAIGNPDDPSSHFREICKPGSGWHVIHLDGLDSPAFTAERNSTPPEVLDKLLSELWVAERKHRWGEASPLYVSKVRGLFPSDDPDGVVRATAVAKCRRPTEYRPDDPALLPVELGVDIGAGGDETVIVLRRGRKATVYQRLSDRDPEVVAGAVVRAVKETRATKVKMDTIGWGWGVAGQVRQNVAEAGLSCQIIGVMVSERSSDPERFPLLRDELWWDIGRETSEAGEWDLSEMEDDTIADLLAPKWKPDARGRVKVEPKDETRKRLGRSPDGGDALLLAFYSGSYGLEAYLQALAYEQESDAAKAARLDAHWSRTP